MGTVLSSKGKKKKSQDKRNSRREHVHARFPVLIFTEEMKAAGDAGISGLLTDIGTRGLGLTCPLRLEMNLKVIVVLYSGSEREQQIVATTVWTDRMPTSGMIIKPENVDGKPVEYWRLGLKIDQNDKELAEFINKTIESL